MGGGQPKEAPPPAPPPETLKQPAPTKRTDKTSGYGDPQANTNPLAIGTKKYRTGSITGNGLTIEQAPSGIQI